MPNWVELPSDDNIKALMKSTIYCPIVELEASTCFLKLPNTDFYTLEYGILDISHIIRHWHLKLDNLGLLTPF